MLRQVCHDTARPGATVRDSRQPAVPRRHSSARTLQGLPCLIDLGPHDATLWMVVAQAHCLHEGINRGGPHEFPSPLAQFPGELLRAAPRRPRRTRPHCGNRNLQRPPGSFRAWQGWSASSGPTGSSRGRASRTARCRRPPESPIPGRDRPETRAPAAVRAGNGAAHDGVFRKSSAGTVRLGSISWVSAVTIPCATKGSAAMRAS